MKKIVILFMLLTVITSVTGCNKDMSQENSSNKVTEETIYENFIEETTITETFVK